MEFSDSKLISALSALGDSTRLRLVKLLLKPEEMCVSELADNVNISVAGTSQQLKVLENAGIITRYRIGQKICYQLDRQAPINKQLIKIIDQTQ